jgi:hypothetical protein
MARLFISLLLLTSSFALIIGMSKYYQNQINVTEQLAISNIEKISSHNPPALGEKMSVGSIDNDTGLINNSIDSDNIDDDKNFEFLNKSE